MSKSFLTLVTTTLTLLLCLSLVSTVQAGSRFADGFRGIAWQTHKDRLPELGLTKKALKNIYKSGPASVLFMEGKGNLALDLDGIPLLSIFMHFYDQQFTGVDLLFKPENRQKVITIITNETGMPEVAEDETTQWDLPGVSITVTDRELLITTVTR